MNRHIRMHRPPPGFLDFWPLALMGIGLGMIMGLPGILLSLFASHPQHDASWHQNTLPSAEVAIARGQDGLFHAHISASGETMQCLIDTGATMLTLSAKQAERLGMPLDQLSYNGAVVTAGGVVPAARATLPTLDFEGHQFDDVHVVITRRGSGPCLIGARLLSRLESVEIHDGQLHLR